MMSRAYDRRFFLKNQHDITNNLHNSKYLKEWSKAVYNSICNFKKGDIVYQKKDVDANKKNSKNEI